MDTRLKNCSALVVDEHAPSRTLITSALLDIGFGVVRTVASAAAAIEHLTESRGKRIDDPMAPPVDLVVTDWDMETISGATFLHWVRMSKRSPSRFLRVIVLSGTLDSEKVEAARRAGVNALMTKPFAIGGLEKHVVHVMDANPMFMKSLSYFGPDRRRRDGAVLTERRLIKNPSNEDLGRATDPNVGAFNPPHIMKHIMDGTPREHVDAVAFNVMHAILEPWAEDYGDSIVQNVRALRGAFKAFIRGGDQRLHAHAAMVLSARRMAREGERMGYPLVSAFALTLMAALEAATSHNRTHGEEIADTAIQGLEAVIHGHVSGLEGKTGHGLVASLEKMNARLKRLGSTSHAPDRQMKKA